LPQTDSHGQALNRIVKRDGRIVDFDKSKITEAIWKAIKSVGGQDRALAERLSNQVVERLGKQLKPGEIPHVEQVQDLVEKVLVENNLYNVAKAYILYRALHAQIREFVDSYLENKSWLVKENANTTYSLQALNFHISSQVISQYWLHRIFNKGRTEIREAHLNGDFHIHNLGILGPYCFDDQTRVLTKEGFKFFKDITLQDEVATVNLKTGYLEYQHPTDKQVFEYSGPLFCFESRSLSLRVTPEHRLLVRERGDGKWKFVNPTNFKRRSEFLKQVKWRGKNSKFFQIPMVKGGNRLRHLEKIPVEVFLKFMGWYLAEGNAWRHDRKDRNSPNYIISIGQRDKKNRREITSLIKRLGFSPNLSEKDHIQFCSKELYFYLKQFGKSDGKFVPQFIKDLDPEKIEIFLFSLFKGDGTIENGKLRRFSTKSKKLAEDVLECLLKIGKSGTLRWDGRRFIVSVRTKQLTPIFNKRPKRVQYEGKVYDLTVPNGTLLVERNGKVVVSGNCVGWDLKDLLMTGFRGVRGKVSAKPAKHFRVALGHVVNFVFTLQGEAAGAQAFSNFDTYLAPFIRYDGLDYKSVKQALQEFMFNMNIPTRVGFQTPFSNITLDLKVPSFMRDEPVIIGGEVLDTTYGEFQEEMNIFNRALAEVMLEGDAVGRVFSVDGECLCPIKNSGRMKLVKIGEYIDEWMEKGKPLYIKENNCEVLDVRAQDIKALGLKDGKIDWCKVNFLVRHPTESLLKIFTAGGFNIKVTPSHSVMVLKEGKLQSFKASMLRKGDYLIMPKFMPLEERKPQVISLANEFAKNGARGVYIRDVYKGGKLYRETRKAVQRRKYGKRIYEYSCDVPVFPLENIASNLSEFDLSKAKLSLRGSSIKLRNLLPLTKELAEFLGYYCAEGSAEKGGISLGFNLKEEREKAIRVAQLARKIFRGVPVRLREVKDRNLIEVRVHSKLLRMVITEIFKVGTGTGRRVPQIIFEAPQEIKKSFLFAYFEGDAWLTENIVVNSVSRELIYGISVLLKQLGVFHTLTEYYRDGKPTWRITVWQDRKLHPKDSYSISKIPIKESGLEMVFEKILEKEPYYFDSLGRKYRNTKIRISKKFGISHSNSTSLQKVKNVIEYAKRLKVEIPPALKEAEKNNILFLKIKKIEKATPSNGMVYDFSTESENFVADQLLVHNTFPIPTINITRDFEWNDETTRTVLETSAKYGIPYFANFINSDMNPEDVRSMCLHPEEEILIKNSGSVMRKNMGEVVKDYAGEFDEEGWAIPRKEFMVLSLNPETWKTEWVKVERFLRVVDNKMVSIVTEDGKEIKVSKNHVIPVVTPIGIVNKLAEHVKPGDILISLRSASHNLSNTYEKIGKLVLDEKLAGLLGFFTADGNYLFESRKSSKFYGLPRGLQFTFRGNNFRLKNRIKRLIKRVLACPIKEKKDPRYNTHYLYVYSSDIAQTFYDAGFRKYGRLPQVVFNSPPTVIRSFLKYFFLGDGYEKNREIHINDSELSRDLTILFSMIGIPVCYKKKKNSQRIYIQHKKSKTNLLGILATPTLHERIPGWMAKSTYLVPGLNKKRMVGTETLSKYEAHTEESRKFLNGDLMFIRVKKCRLVSLRRNQEFFDIELEKNHLFVHSLGNITHNCCHLRLDKRELKKRGGGLFGANPLTGSIGVVTINMPRIGFLSKSEGEFFARLDRMMVLAKDVLEIKRKWLEKFTEAGLYPYSRFYLRHIKEAFGHYWKNHFGTIGLIGMNEACLNFLGRSIGDPEGLSFTIKVLDYMRKRLQDFQEETGNIYNLEATPAEGTSHRLARIDKKTYPGIIVANEEEVKKGAAPYYTNSTHLPVYYTDDLWEYLRHQDPLQTKYTGGTVAHVWLGESNPPVESVASLVRKICENFKLPYFTLTPTFSICPEDGYLSGEQHTCPKCGRTTEVYSRVVGYLRPVEQWNQGKQEEFKQRRVFDKALAKKLSVSITSDT